MLAYVTTNLLYQVLKLCSRKIGFVADEVVTDSLSVAVGASVSGSLPRCCCCYHQTECFRVRAHRMAHYWSRSYAPLRCKTMKD